MSGFDFLTLEDAYQERHPRTYALQGITEMPSVNILYGTPTSMKSMLLADKVHCILNGIPWLQNDHGALGVQTNKTGILWVDFDNGRRRTLDRLAAVGRHYGTRKDAPLYIVSCPAEGLNMRSPESFLRLESTISSDVGYVVVDNLGYVSGGADENSTEMVPVMGAFRTLAERTGVAFDIVHHERKSSASAGERAGDKIRGSTSIEGALDRAFRVVRTPGEDLITVYSVKERDQAVKPMSARFKFVHDIYGELREAWFVGETADTVEFKVQKSILSFVEYEKRNQTQVIKHVHAEFEKEKVGRPAITKALNNLVNTGRLITTPGNCGAILYEKPTDKQTSLDTFTDIVPTNAQEPREFPGL